MIITTGDHLTAARHVQCPLPDKMFGEVLQGNMKQYTYEQR